MRTPFVNNLGNLLKGIENNQFSFNINYLQNWSFPVFKNIAKIFKTFKCFVKCMHTS